MRYPVTTMVLLLSQCIGAMASATTTCPPVDATNTPPAHIHDSNVMVFVGTLTQGKAMVAHIEGCALSEAECSYTSHESHLNVLRWEKNEQEGKKQFRILGYPTCQPNLKPLETGKMYRIYAYPNKNYGEKADAYSADHEAGVSLLFYESYTDGKH